MKLKTEYHTRKIKPLAATVSNGPKVSLPISVASDAAMVSSGANCWLILFTIQLKSRPYNALVMASLASVSNERR